MSRKRKNRSDGDYGERRPDRDRNHNRDDGSRGQRAREGNGRDVWSDDDDERSRAADHRRRGKHGSDRIHNRGTKRRID